MEQIKKILFWIIFCFSIGNIYASTTQDIVTEQAFSKQLMQLDPTAQITTVAEKKPLTREKAAVLIVDFLGYEAIAQERDNVFQDVVRSQGEINLVNELGLMSGTGNGKFSASQTVSSEVAKVVVNRLADKINEEIKWSHICYAINSSSQMEEIKNHNAVSFGWAELKIEPLGNGFTLSTEDKTSDFRVPDSFEVPIDYAKSKGVETYLMVYLENQGDNTYRLLSNAQQRTQLISELVSLTNGITKADETRNFDGLTIDFEQLKNENLREIYVTFLKELKTELTKQNKKLNVAVQPTTYFKGYSYKGIGETADHVILMAHDYATKTLSVEEQASGICMTPVTPVNQVYECLKEASDSIQDKSKIVLQMSFDSRQWQLKDGKVIHSIAYTPSYDKIEARLKDATTQIKYDDKSQNPYATYVSDGIQNVIWYENTKSMKAKKNLAKMLGIQNLSYWRLGVIRILA